MDWEETILSAQMSPLIGLKSASLLQHQLLADVADESPCGLEADDQFELGRRTTGRSAALACGLAFRRSRAGLRQFALCRRERKLLILGNDLEHAVA